MDDLPAFQVFHRPHYAAWRATHRALGEEAVSAIIRRSIVRLHSQGWGAADIAGMIGLTRQRVEQLLDAYNIVDRPRGSVRRVWDDSRRRFRPITRSEHTAHEAAARRRDPERAAARDAARAVARAKRRGMLAATRALVASLDGQCPTQCQLRAALGLHDTQIASAWNPHFFQRPPSPGRFVKGKSRLLRLAGVRVPRPETQSRHAPLIPAAFASVAAVQADQGLRRSRPANLRRMSLRKRRAYVVARLQRLTTVDGVPPTYRSLANHLGVSVLFLARCFTESNHDGYGWARKGLAALYARAGVGRPMSRQEQQHRKAKADRRAALATLRQLADHLGRTPTMPEVCQSLRRTEAGFVSLWVGRRSPGYHRRGTARFYRLAGMVPQPPGVRAPRAAAATMARCAVRSGERS
ncbi:MAG: hypothetical protein H3C62_00730 [Gemmatimonadaceae bacterium]|nr:hypothetical protein [Gemmatimonadaceae bacterium]